MNRRGTAGAARTGGAVRLRRHPVSLDPFLLAGIGLHAVLAYNVSQLAASLPPALRALRLDAIEVLRLE